MSWFGRITGRDAARAVKTQLDAERLSALIQSTLPASSRPRLATQITEILRLIWENGKSSYPPHVSEAGLTLYNPDFLLPRIKVLWDNGVESERRGGMDAKIDAYACYIAAYYLNAMIVLQTLPNFGGDTAFGIMRKVKELCQGEPDPFPHF